MLFRLEGRGARLVEASAFLDEERTSVAQLALERIRSRLR